MDGFTIRNGLADQGGGIYALGTSIFRNLLVTDNEATSIGGAIYGSESPTIERCRIVNNRAPTTPGIGFIGRFLTYHARVERNIIEHNVATDSTISGGAISIGGHMAADINFNLVVENTVPNGALYMEECFGVITVDHNTFARNGKVGLNLESAINVHVSNSIIFFHTLSDVAADSVSKPQLRYSDIGTIAGLAVTDNLLSVNPQFADTAKGDYSLKPTSPCIDAGDPAYPRDPDSTVTDLGALPYLNQIPTGVGEAPTGPPQQFVLEPAFPNPFSAATRFALQLPAGTEYSVSIYDILGRRVTVLRKGRSDGSRIALRWDGRDRNGAPLADGVYLISVETGGTRHVSKVLLLR